jgi:hypothetical protein
MATSGSFAGNSVTYGCYMFVNWQLASQEIGNNRSLINWQAYFHFQGSDTQLDNGVVNSNVGNLWSNGGRVYNFTGNYSTRDMGLASGSFWVNHDGAGNGAVQLAVGITTQFSPTRSEGTSGVWSLPTIPRHCVMNSAPNFNDEQNPVFNYSNPANTAVDFYLETPTVGGSSGFANRTLGTGGGGNYTLVLTDTERNTIRSRMPSSNTMTVRFVVHDTLGGSHSWSWVDRTVTLINGNPTFLDYDYRDSNSTTSTLTGDNQVLVQGKSTLEMKVLVADKALPLKSATMVKYNSQISSVNQDTTYSSGSDVTQSLGSIGVSGTTPLVVKAIDSRNNQTSITKNINILPYTAPLVIATADRINNFETTTDVHIEGVISRLTLGGTDKNSVNTTSGVQYRYKKTSDVSWGSWTNRASTTSSGNVSTTDFQLSLDRNFAWNLQVKITDALETTTLDVLVTVGIPIFRIGLDGNIYNNEIRMLTEDDILAENPYKFSAYKSANSSYNDGTTNDVVFNTELYDTNGDFNTTTGVFTVPVTGYYFIAGSVRIGTNNVGSGGSKWLWDAMATVRNHTDSVDLETSKSYVYQDGRMTIFDAKFGKLHYLVAGKQIKLRCFADTNEGSQFTLNGGIVATYISGHLVSKA